MAGDVTSASSFLTGEMELCHTPGAAGASGRPSAHRRTAPGAQSRRSFLTSVAAPLPGSSDLPQSRSPLEGSVCGTLLRGSALRRSAQRVCSAALPGAPSAPQPCPRGQPSRPEWERQSCAEPPVPAGGSCQTQGLARGTGLASPGRPRAIAQGPGTVSSGDEGPFALRNTTWVKVSHKCLLVQTHHECFN